MLKLTSKQVLGQITAEAKRGKILVPTEQTLMTDSSGKYLKPWPLLVFHNDVQFVVVSFNAKEIYSLGEQLTLNARSLLMDGLLALKPLFEAYVHFVVIANDVYTLVKYLQDTNLALDRLYGKALLK